MKLSISAADFVYAIVVSAAFQRISEPSLSATNLLLILSFVVILDDWILYHLVAATLPSDARPHRLQILGDLAVLLVWYWAALAAGQAQPNTVLFLALLCGFYVTTSISELLLGFVRVDFNLRSGVIHYRRMGVSFGRTAVDGACAAYLGVLALLLWKGVMPSSAGLVVVAAIPMLSFRVLTLWRLFESRLAWADREAAERER